MTLAPYRYNAVVTAAHDGDTITVALDMGFNLTLVYDVRLLGCNARELSMPGGPEARAHLLGLCPIGTAVTVTSVAWDKYSGRIDALIGLPDGTDLTADMIRDGYAAAWDGTGSKPVAPWPIPTSKGQ